MTEMCTVCPSRSICSTLCPEAELYVKQDEAKQKELTIGIPRFGKWPDGKDKPLFTRKERKILGSFLLGKSRAEIAQDLGMTRKTLREHIRNIRHKSQEKTPMVVEEVYP